MSKKFDLDKYYTPDNIAEYVVQKTFEIVGNNFDVVIDPSSGGGAYIPHIEKYFPKSEKIYMDLLPTSNVIIQQDFLTYDTTYLKNKKVLLITNPPFGKSNTLSVAFYKKAITFANYISFIQSSGQLNNNQQMYEFDLINSEDLGRIDWYNDIGNIKQVWCCFNIYRRPDNGLFNKQKRYDYKNFKIIELRRYESIIDNKTLDGLRGICGWGASLGKEIEFKGQYANELYFDGDDEIIDFCMSYDWLSYVKTFAPTTPYLTQWRVYEKVKKHFNLIPEIDTHNILNF